MTENVIEPPFAGGKMRASWGASVARAVNAHEAELQSLRQPGKWESLRTGEDAIAPFTVRYDAALDKWLVYLPSGCMNVVQTCTPINTEIGGGWYSFALDETQGTTQTLDNGATARSWSVTAHAKCRANVAGVDPVGTTFRRLLFVGAQDRLVASPTDAQLYRDTPGDTFACEIARVTVTQTTDATTNETTTTRQVQQLRNTVVDIAHAPEASSFDLVWWLRVEHDELSVDKLCSVRNIGTVAGMVVTGDELVDVTGAGAVYAKIYAADMTSGRGILSVVKDPPAATVTAPGEYDVWLPLYDLKHNTVTADTRAFSLQNVQLYRA